MDMITQIHSGVYDMAVHQSGDVRYRVFLFDGERPTLVDTEFEDTIDVVGSALDELDIDLKRGIVTHGDPDHVGGLSGLSEEYDVVIWDPEQTDLDADVIKRVGNLVVNHEAIAEVDVNPVLATSTGAVALAVTVILREE